MFLNGLLGDSLIELILFLELSYSLEEDLSLLLKLFVHLEYLLAMASAVTLSMVALRIFVFSALLGGVM